MNDLAIVSSSSATKYYEIGLEELTLEYTNLPISRHALKHANHSFKRKCPPSVNRAKKKKILVEVQCHVMVGMESILWEQLLKSGQVCLHMLQVGVRVT
jgi:hypothetical protein